MVFVLGRKCAMLLKYSSVCLFFCNGYVSESAAPITSSSSTASSAACFPPGLATSFPLTRSAAPVETLPEFATSHAALPSFTTACIPEIALPSFRSINAIPFCVRTLLAHPLTSNSSPTRLAPPSRPLTRAIRSGRPYAAVATARVVVRPRTIDDARVTDTTARETRMVVRLLASSRAALSTTSFIEHTPRHIPFRSRVPVPSSPSRLRARGVCHDMAWHDRGFG